MIKTFCSMESATVLLKSLGWRREIERKEGHLFIYETVIYLRDREGQFLSLDEKGFVQFDYGIVGDAGIHAAACQIINPYYFKALPDL
ncbi:hypothetical protein [Bartonella grahamii]|uniref:hypothetical protein n=1 Tax=Bartonella grahamii TaxID=33045 RepID=UPI0011C03282|nr:hypothetical protein [Bartonella grahamii]